jgi:hypothetical protein
MADELMKRGYLHQQFTVTRCLMASSSMKWLCPNCRPGSAASPTAAAATPPDPRLVGIELNPGPPGMEITVLHRGYLHQQVSVTRCCLRRKKIWQRVFALLKDGCLFLYESPRDLQPLQTVPLYASCCLFPQYPKVARSNCLQLETPTTSMYLCADSPADIKSWAIHIQKAAIVASGGNIGKLNPAPAPAATSPAPPRSNTPNPSARSLHGRSASNADGSVDALHAHSSEAAALISSATTAAAYDRVLHRFRSSCLVTSFTDNSLACLAAGGGYSKHRAQAKRRIASEWLWETKQHAKENRQRAAGANAIVQMEYFVRPLGSLQLERTSIHVRKGAGTLTVSNEMDYPLAVRLGDESTAAWMQTNTPIFLAGGATVVLQLSLLAALSVPAPAAASSSSSSSSSSGPSPVAAAPYPVPPLPTRLSLSCKPCDRSDLDSAAPHLLFRDDDGEANHRIGERYEVTIEEAPPAVA